LGLVIDNQDMKMVIHLSIGVEPISENYTA